MLRIFHRSRFGQRGSWCRSNLDFLAAATILPENNRHEQQQQVRYNWAPPAYRKQESFSNGQKKYRRGGGRARGGRSRSPAGKHHNNHTKKKWMNKKRQLENRNKSSRDPKDTPHHHDDKKETGELFQWRKVQLLQKNLMELMERYQSMLGGDVHAAAASRIVDNNDDMGVMLHDMEPLLMQGRDLCSQLQAIQEANQKLTAQQLDETEQTCIEISRVMHRLIMAWTRVQPVTINNDELDDKMNQAGSEEAVHVDNDQSSNKSPSPLAPHDVAEQLLLALLQLQSHRSQSPATSDEVTVDQEEQKWSWKVWLYNTFVQSPGEDDKDAAIETESQVGQEEMATSKEKEHRDVYESFQKLFIPVLKCIADGMQPDMDEAFSVERGTNLRALALCEDYDGRYWNECFTKREYNSEPQQQVARRLMFLLNHIDTHMPDGYKVDHRVLNLVLEAYVLVGTYASAKEAEGLYNQCKQHGWPATSFHTVLKAYRLAATLDPTVSNRKKATRRADQLLQFRQGNANRNRHRKEKDLPNSARNCHRRSPRNVVTTYKLVLQTLLNGSHSIPDVTKRAESLVQLLMGKDDFQKLVDGSWQNSPLVHQPDAGYLHYLLLIYVKSRRVAHFERAKQLLQYMETQRDNRLQRSDNDALGVSFPNAWSYNAVILGLRNFSKASNTPEVNMENAIYGTGLFDSMSKITFFHSFRPYETFNFLVKLWKLTNSLEAGEQAENILSRMEIQSAASGYLWRTSSHAYYEALQCWSHSAAAGQPGAALRAKQLMERYHAQGRPLSRVTNDRTQEVDMTGVYRDFQPSLFAYIAVIEACASTCHDADLDVALEVAFNTYNEMIENGVRPNGATYSRLLECCANLLQNDHSRRLELSRQVFQAACDQGEVRKNVLEALKKANPELHNSYHQSGRVMAATEEDSIAELAPFEEEGSESDDYGGDDIESEDDGETVGTRELYNSYRESGHVMTAKEEDSIVGLAPFEEEGSESDDYDGDDIESEDDDETVVTTSADFAKAASAGELGVSDQRPTDSLIFYEQSSASSQREKDSILTGMQLGDWVSIIGGSFAGDRGVITKVTEKKVKVSIAGMGEKMLNRENVALTSSGED